jgi:hypothetical protein
MDRGRVLSLGKIELSKKHGTLETRLYSTVVLAFPGTVFGDGVEGKSK